MSPSKSRTCAFVLVCSVIGACTLRAQNGKTVDQVYKNIRVLKGLPAADMDNVMALISSALGVHCDHCHGSAKWDQDDRPAKETARRMLEMTGRINALSFNGANVVSCYTCHRGQLHPEFVPEVKPHTNTTSGPAERSVEEVLARYNAAAISGAGEVTSRVRNGTFSNSNGAKCPLEVYEEAPDKLLSVLVQYGKAVGTVRRLVVSGKGWTADKLGARPLNAVDTAKEARDWQFARVIRPEEWREMYTKMTFVGRQKIRDRDAYRIDAESTGLPPERLMFDVESGLLLRRIVLNTTPAGASPEENDFEDYRDVDGMKLPFTIRKSRVDYRSTRQFDRVAHNIPLDSARFQLSTSLQ